MAYFNGSLPFLRGQTRRYVVCTYLPRNLLNTHNERVNLIRLPGGRHLPRLGKATRNFARAACTKIVVKYCLASSLLCTLRDAHCKN